MSWFRGGGGGVGSNPQGSGDRILVVGFAGSGKSSLISQIISSSPTSSNSANVPGQNIEINRGSLCNLQVKKFISPTNRNSGGGGGGACWLEFLEIQGQGKNNSSSLYHPRTAEAFYKSSNFDGIIGVFEGTDSQSLQRLIDQILRPIIKYRDRHQAVLLVATKMDLTREGTTFFRDSPAFQLLQQQLGGCNLIQTSTAYALDMTGLNYFFESLSARPASSHFRN